MQKTSKGKEDISVMVIQPAYAKYRKPLFAKFVRNYNTSFFFVYKAESYLQISQHNAERAFASRYSQIYSRGSPVHRLIFLVKRHLTLFSTLVRQHYSVIITSTCDNPHTIVSLIASKISGSKCVLWSEEWFLPRSKSLRSWILLFPQVLLRRLVLKTVDAVAVEGKPQYRFVKNFNIPAGKVFIANHCSLDYSLFKSRSLKKEYGINEYLVVLYLGRIVQNKGLDVLIRAFSRIEKERDGIFLIVGGDGFLRPRCERLANELSVKHILFLGAIHGEETVASWYKSADIFVMPSLIGTYERLWVEGWGLAINEAMSMGKPVITTDAVGAAIDLVKNNINGYIVKQGDVDDLYLALKRIIDDPEKREAMGRNSRRIFEDFNDFDKMFSGFQAAIQYVTARPSIRRKTKGQDST